MSFPTTPVLDTFNRTAEDPLSDGGKWTNNFEGSGSLKTDGTTCAISSGTSGQAVRNDVTPGPDCEVYVTQSAEPDVGSGSIALYARLVNLGAGTTDGYTLDCPRERSGTDEWRLFRRDNGVDTQLGASFLQEVINGDSMGLEIVGSTLTVYYRSQGGGWTSLGTRTDATYSAAGSIGVFLNGSTSPVVNDFGGGTVVAPGRTPYQPWTQRAPILAQ